MPTEVLLNLSFIALVMVLAGLSVAAFQRSLQAWNWRQPYRPLDLGSAKEHAARFVSAAAIKVLLPTLFLESLLKHADRLGEIAAGVMIGALFALATLASGRFLTPLAPKTHISDIAHVVGATFGGGNRGVALLIIATLLLGLDRDLYLAYFYSVDFGNFLVFLFAIPAYLRFVGGNRQPHSWILGNDLKRIGIPNVVIIVFVLLALSGRGQWLIDITEDLLVPTSRERSFLMLYLSFVLVFLQINLRVTLAAAIANLLLITVARAISLLILLAVLLGIQAPAAAPGLPSPYALALAILVLCPPSSQIGAQVKEHYGKETAVEDANTLNAIMVFIYLAFVGSAVLGYAWLHA